MDQNHPRITSKATDERASSRAFALDFDPVPVRYRRDGWTPERQRTFIAGLRECRCVLEACRRVGRSSESAYKLYRRPDAASFRRAWDAALTSARPQRRPSTFAGAAQTHGMCQVRQHRQLPDGPQLPPSGPLRVSSRPSERQRTIPAYSLEAFARLTRFKKGGKASR